MIKDELVQHINKIIIDYKFNYIEIITLLFDVLLNIYKNDGLYIKDNNKALHRFKLFLANQIFKNCKTKLFMEELNKLLYLIEYKSILYNNYHTDNDFINFQFDENQMVLEKLLIDKINILENLS